MERGLLEVVGGIGVGTEVEQQLARVNVPVEGGEVDRLLTADFVAQPGGVDAPLERVHRAWVDWWWPSGASRGVDGETRRDGAEAIALGADARGEGCGEPIVRRCARWVAAQLCVPRVA